MLRLPTNRRLLKSSFLLGFLPAYLALVTVGSGCSGGCSGDFRIPGSSSASRAGFFDGDIFFPSGEEPSAEVLYPAKKKATVMTITLGMPFSLPPGVFRVFGDVTALATSSARSALPTKFNLWMDLFPAVKGKKTNLFKTVLKRNGLDFNQTKDAFKGMNAEAGETVAFVVKPKGGDVAFDQLYHFFYAMLPGGPSDAWGWLQAGASVAPSLPRLQAALEEAPAGAGGLPLPPVTLPAVSAGAKMLIAELGFGFPVGMPSFTALFGGMYVQADGSSNVPDSVDVLVTILDGDGNTVATVSETAELNGTEIPQVEVIMPAIDLTAGGRIRVEATPNGGNIENGDQMSGFIVFFTDV